MTNPTNFPKSNPLFYYLAAQLGNVSTISNWTVIKTSVGGTTYEMALPTNLYSYATKTIIPYNAQDGQYDGCGFPQPGTVFTVLQMVNKSTDQIIGKMPTASGTWYQPNQWSTAKAGVLPVPYTTTQQLFTTDSYQDPNTNNNYSAGPYLAWLPLDQSVNPNNFDPGCFSQYRTWAVLQATAQYICPIPVPVPTNTVPVSQAKMQFSFQSNPGTSSPRNSDLFFQWQNTIPTITSVSSPTTAFLVPYSTGNGAAIGAIDLLFYSPKNTDTMQQEVVQTGQRGYVEYIYVYYNASKGNPNLASFSSIILDPTQNTPFLIDPGVLYYNANTTTTNCPDYFNTILSTGGVAGGGIPPSLSYAPTGTTPYEYDYCGYIGVNLGLGQLDGNNNQNAAMQAPDGFWNTGTLFLGSYSTVGITSSTLPSYLWGDNIIPTQVGSSQTVTVSQVQKNTPFCSGS